MNKEENSTGRSLQVEPMVPLDQHGVGLEQVLESAHTINHDSYGQVGLLLVTSFNCGYILSFSNLTLVPLGWTWGVSSLIVVGLFTAYANWLLSGFHFIDGRRFIRYRDLMGHLFGRKMFHVTWSLQFSFLLFGNMGFLLLGGKALKAINSEFSDSPMRLQYFIVITGASYFIFALLFPTLSSMRNWLGIYIVLTFTYITILLVVIFQDGKSNKERKYDISGSNVSKVMNTLSAISAIVFCNTSGILPEIQSTLRRPAVTNMRRALYLQYSVGLLFYYGVSIAGYWAYGADVSTYLPEDLSGPKWAKVTINAISFFHSIISQHMFIAPIHETLDTNFLRLDKSIHSRENLKKLLLLRLLVFTVTTWTTSALPFMGDFVNVLGSLSLIPLTFIFPSMIYIKVKINATRLKKLWHKGLIVLFLLLTIAATLSAIILFVNNIREYHFFTDA